MFSRPVLPLVLASIEVVDKSMLENFRSFWKFKFLFYTEALGGILTIEHAKRAGFTRL